MALIRISSPRSVPLQPLLPLFHRLNREHFGVLVDGAAADGGALERWPDEPYGGFYRRGPGW